MIASWSLLLKQTWRIDLHVTAVLTDGNTL
jgi:hypothetical protein